MGQNKRAGKKERVGAQQGAQGTYSLIESPLESFHLVMQFQFGRGGSVRVRKLRLRFQENKLS